MTRVSKENYTQTTHVSKETYSRQKRPEMCQKRCIHTQETRESNLRNTSVSKETYSHQKRPEKCQKRCLLTQEICESTIHATHMLQKRPINIKRDLYISKETTENVKKRPQKCPQKKKWIATRDMCQSRTIYATHMCQKRPVNIKKRPQKCQKRCICTRGI